MPLPWALLRAAATDSRLDCAAAFAACGSRVATPARVSEAAGALGTRVTRCRLGLFGRPAGAPSEPSAAAPVLGVARQAERRLPCGLVWRLAPPLGGDRLLVGRATNVVGASVAVCQLRCA
jgi:hypothetical protein